MRTNEAVRGSLSKDLGAFAGLLFEIGTGRLIVTGNADAVFRVESEKAEKAARLRHADVEEEKREESEHTRMQYLLIRRRAEEFSRTSRRCVALRRGAVVCERVARQPRQDLRA